MQKQKEQKKTEAQVLVDQLNQEKEYGWDSPTGFLQEGGWETVLYYQSESIDWLKTVSKLIQGHDNRIYLRNGSIILLVKEFNTWVVLVDGEDKTRSGYPAFK